MAFHQIGKHNPLYIYAQFSLLILSLLSLSRFVMSLWQHERISAVDGWSHILLQGLRIDIATLSILLVIPVLISVIISGPQWLIKCWRRIQQFWLTFLMFFLLFMELSTPSFIIEYNIRPNRLFIEYLIYPKEVVPMLLKSHLVEIIVTLIICISAMFLTWNYTGRQLQKINAFNWRLRPWVFIACLFVLALGGRSTLGHRPINPAMVYFSSDPLVNSLVLNSLYSVGFATKQLMNEESGQSSYGHLPDAQIIQTIREIKGIGKLPIIDPEIPTLSEQKASNTTTKKNLVIILEESLGARFVGSLGGLPLTPNIDELSKEGWYFESMLATGTRSVRGIEAVTTGFTPTPDRAVVKLDKSQKDFFTIASLLKAKGYHTEFIYGGEAHFDNMKSFFLGNGFDHITEEKDYNKPLYKGSWGVSDEDLFTKSHEKFEEFSESKKPFFSLVFTSSNHTPFEYPMGRIQPYDTEPNTRNNAIKYADWALGEFFKKAKKSSYWENTLFLVIADHDANAHGADLVPPKSFHIPALILGNGIEVKQDKRLVSQLDMPVTMLSLMGIDNYNPMIGRDLTQNNDTKGLAYLQYGQNFALLEGDIAIILQPEKSPLKYHFNQKDFSLTKSGMPTLAESERALAVSLWGKLAYSKQYYRLPLQK